MLRTLLASIRRVCFAQSAALILVLKTSNACAHGCTLPLTNFSSKVTRRIGVFCPMASAGSGGYVDI